MSEQVEALEIANKVDTKIVSYPPRYVYCDAAAAELRRQHHEIQELKKAKEELLDALQSLIDEYEPNMKTFATDAPRKAKWVTALAAVHLYKD